MVNNGYIAFALMGMVLAVPLTTPTQYKDTEYTKNIASNLPTPTPTPEPTTAPVAASSAIVERVVVREVITEVAPTTVVVEVPVAPEPEQTVVEAVMTNVAGKVYGYEKNDKGKK